MTYAINKERAKYRDTTPTKTDQSSAKQTDINIIVGQQLITGYAPGTPKPPMYEDFTQFPTDLREALDASYGVQHLRARLPEEIRNAPVDQLLKLTPQQLTQILTPPKPEKPKEEQPKP